MDEARERALLAVVRVWETEAREHLLTAGAMTPGPYREQLPKAQAKLRDEHLLVGQQLRRAAGDVRHVLDWPAEPSILRDPLAR